MKHVWLMMLGLGWLGAQELPPGLPPEAVQPKALPAETAVPDAVVVPAAPPADEEVAVPARIPVDHYQTLWQRSPFELSIQSANAAPTGIAADWLLTSVSRADGQPMAILFNKTSGETAVVKTKETGPHGLRLVSAEIMSDYRKSKVKVSRGSEQAELIFQEQDLTSLSALAPATPAAVQPNAGNMPGITKPVVTGGNLPGASSFQSGTGTSTATPRPPRRVIIRPKPVTPP